MDKIRDGPPRRTPAARSTRSLTPTIISGRLREVVFAHQGLPLASGWMVVPELVSGAVTRKYLTGLWACMQAGEDFDTASFLATNTSQKLDRGQSIYKVINAWDACELRTANCAQ